MRRRRGPVRLAAAWIPTVILLSVLEACGPAPGNSVIRISHPSTLVGTVWQLAAVGRVAVPTGTTASLDFGPTELSGESTCNAFGATYAYGPTTGALRIGNLVSTKRACLDPGFNGIEPAMLAGLRGATDASIDSQGRLVLSGVGAELAFEVGPTLERPNVTAGSSPTASASH